jgi:hypothetical protein
MLQACLSDPLCKLGFRKLPPLVLFRQLSGAQRIVVVLIGGFNRSLLADFHEFTQKCIRCFGFRRGFSLFAILTDK